MKDFTLQQNIFIVHTPFQVYISELMVSGLHEFENSKNILLLEFNRSFEHINRELWSKVIYLENVGCSTMGLRRFLMCEKNVDLIQTLVDENLRSSLFISDIAWPMNNRLFFDTKLRRKATFCLISDGLGTYLLPRVTWILFIRGTVKFLNGLIHFGVRYRNYWGSQFGVDRKRIKYIYAPNVEFVECDLIKKKEILTASMMRPLFDKSKCIFLETNGWLVVNEKDWQLIRINTVRFLKSLGVEIYYKNHPFGRKEEEVYYQSQGFYIIEANKCAEQIITEEGFGIAVSYVSSSLFNLKSMYMGAIRCIALSNKLLNLSHDYNENKRDEVYRLFRKVNTEVLEI